jgi:hypothetical protein
VSSAFPTDRYIKEGSLADGSSTAGRRAAKRLYIDRYGTKRR